MGAVVTCSSTSFHYHQDDMCLGAMHAISLHQYPQHRGVLDNGYTVQYVIMPIQHIHQNSYHLMYILPILLSVYCW